MNELAKWAWIILLIVLFLGPWAILLFAVEAVAYVLILWLKPDWINDL